MVFGLQEEEGSKNIEYHNPASVKTGRNKITFITTDGRRDL